MPTGTFLVYILFKCMKAVSLKLMILISESNIIYVSVK